MRITRIPAYLHSVAFTLAVFLLVPISDRSGQCLADEKAKSLQSASVGRLAPHSDKFQVPHVGGKGHRTKVGEGDHQYPLVVLRGTPYQMGWHLGQLMREEIHQFVPNVLANISQQIGVDQDLLREVWTRSAAYADDRVEQELAGLADGSGLRLSLLQAMHAVPLLLPYSCSSIAAWGNATEDGHLYQTRNLDWNMEVGAHEFATIVLYIPDQGNPHIVPTFAGMIGAHTGMNIRGIALSEMGDASGKEAPYQVHAPHFTVFFRTLLYDANSLTQATEIFNAQPPTKRYHYVFGDGQADKRAVKIRAHSPEPEGRWLNIWKDNDPADEVAPNVLRCVVYNDEGRGAFPTLQKEQGKLNGEKLVALANQIPIRGSNVENVVYDATALRLWVSYARGKQEAFERPYAYIDLKKVDADQDGQPDLP